jgi:hypothetical protein
MAISKADRCTWSGKQSLNNAGVLEFDVAIVAALSVGVFGCLPGRWRGFLAAFGEQRWVEVENKSGIVPGSGRISPCKIT